MTESTPISISSEGAALPVKRASLVERSFAYVIDLIILGVVTGCLGFAGASAPLPALWSVITLAIPVVYFVWPYSTSGQTLGKRALKIKVVSIDGSPLNWGKGILRTIGYVLSDIPLGLGFLWPIWDADKQAGHDKIAGTLVVPSSVAREQLQGTIELSEVRRRQKRWLVGLGVPTLLMAAGFLLVIQTSLHEVREMGPWPSHEIPAGELVRMDLSHLGLEAGPIQDARGEETWAGGAYQDGVLMTYASGAESVLYIWALRYETARAAASDYSSAQAVTERTCGLSTNAQIGSAGVIHCQYDDAYSKLFWSGCWIVYVLAQEGTEITPDVLVDQVRDAMAAHWRTVEKASH